MFMITVLALSISIAAILYIAVPTLIKFTIAHSFTRRATQSPYAFLTFDDGPHPKATPRILELLREARVKATFFLIGRHADRHPQLVKDILWDGHLIGEHGYDHLHAWKANPIRFIEDLKKSRSTLDNLATSSRTSRYFRPAFGKLNLISILYIWYHRLEVVLWNVDPRDYAAENGEEVADYVSSRLTPGQVILLHDGRYQNTENLGSTVDGLAKILEYAQRKGITFTTIDKLFP